MAANLVGLLMQALVCDAPGAMRTPLVAEAIAGGLEAAFYRHARDGLADIVARLTALVTVLVLDVIW